MKARRSPLRYVSLFLFYARGVTRIRTLNTNNHPRTGEYWCFITASCLTIMVSNILKDFKDPELSRIGFSSFSFFCQIWFGVILNRATHPLIPRSPLNSDLWPIRGKHEFKLQRLTITTIKHKRRTCQGSIDVLLLLPCPNIVVSNILKDFKGPEVSKSILK